MARSIAEDSSYLIGYEDFKDEPEQITYMRVFEHKKTQERIAFPLTYLSPAMRSTIRFRRRIQYAIESINFIRWITFTYNSKNLPMASEHMTDVMGKWRNFIWKVNRRHKNRGKKEIKKLDYVWRVDYGEKKGRPHFHMIATHYVSIERLREWWGRGFVWITKLKDKNEVKEYVGKYMAKIEEDIEEPAKRYGCSRGIPKTPPSEWKFIDFFRTDEYTEIVTNHNLSLAEDYHIKDFFGPEKNISYNDNVDGSSKTEVS